MKSTTTSRPLNVLAPSSSRAQVLDHSTGQHTRIVTDQYCHQWTERGIEINIHRRSQRYRFNMGSLSMSMVFTRQAE